PVAVVCTLAVASPGSPRRPARTVPGEFGGLLSTSGTRTGLVYARDIDCAIKKRRLAGGVGLGQWPWWRRGWRGPRAELFGCGEAARWPGRHGGQCPGSADRGPAACGLGCRVRVRVEPFRPGGEARPVEPGTRVRGGGAAERPGPVQQDRAVGRR